MQHYSTVRTLGLDVVFVKSKLKSFCLLSTVSSLQSVIFLESAQCLGRKAPGTPEESGRNEVSEAGVKRERWCCHIIALQGHHLA